MDKKKVLLRILLALGLFFLVLEIGGYSIGIYKRSQWKRPGSEVKIAEGSLKALKAKNLSLKRRMKTLAPKGIYLAIDTGENKIYIKKGTAVLREAVVSCGSGDVLEEPGGKRKWVFDTPRGEFSVKSKLVDPTWIKPDWAFIEEGEEIPQDYDERIDNDSLGDYALGFGNGYFIHGTLYTRLLGRNVTHGCIRLGDEDLKFIFRSVSIGTRIFIF